MSRNNIPGRDAYLHIYDRFLRSNPRQNAIVVEIGVALGKSISYIAEECARIGRDDIVIYGVDPFAGTAMNGEQQALAKDAGGCFSLYCEMMRTHAPKAFERVRILRTEGWRAARLFNYASVDCLVLDGDHTFDAVDDELRAWDGASSKYRPCRDNCIIGGDDFHAEMFPGVIRAVTEHFDGLDAIEVHNDQDWPTWVRK